MKKKKIYLLILGSLFLLFFLFTNKVTLAKDTIFNPQVTIPNSVFEEGTDVIIGSSTTSIGEYVKSIYDYLLAIAGLLAAIVIMISGVMWLTAGGNSEKISQSKSWMMGSFTGLVLMLTSYVILKTINPHLVDFRITGIERIEPKIYCCHKLRGKILQKEMSFEDETKNKYYCPARSEICSENQKCIKTSDIDSTTNTNIWGCFSNEEIKKFKCCEYTDGLGSIGCKTVMGSNTCPESLGALNFKTSYKEIMCDPEGSSRNTIYGGKCVYPGTPKQCCQCRYGKPGLFGYLTGYFYRDCKDDYSEGACQYWCSPNNIISLALTSWEARSMPGICQSDGYCK